MRFETYGILGGINYCLFHVDLHSAANEPELELVQDARARGA